MPDWGMRQSASALRCRSNFNVLFRLGRITRSGFKV